MMILLNEKSSRRSSFAPNQSPDQRWTNGSMNSRDMNCIIRLTDDIINFFGEEEEETTSFVNVKKTKRIPFLHIIHTPRFKFFSSTLAIIKANHQSEEFACLI